MLTCTKHCGGFCRISFKIKNQDNSDTVIEKSGIFGSPLISLFLFLTSDYFLSTGVNDEHYEIDEENRFSGFWFDGFGFRAATPLNCSSTSTVAKPWRKVRVWCWPAKRQRKKPRARAVV